MRQARFMLSSKPEALRAARPDVTVEAEYGEEVVEGLFLTMAHHGPRAGNPAPCSYGNGCVGAPFAEPDGTAGASTSPLVVGLSHVDLDTVGGCMAMLGCKPEAPTFWALAEFVDLRGAHRLAESGASEADLARLYAYWAFSRTERVFPPRDGSVADVTEAVMRHVTAVQAILGGDSGLLAAGAAFRAAESKLNEESFDRVEAGLVILRRSGTFVNHLYTAVGRAFPAVVNWNDGDAANGSITASLASPEEHPAVNVGKLLGEMFGPLAGGHAGIGGSERGVKRPREDAERFALTLAAALLRDGARPVV